MDNNYTQNDEQGQQQVTYQQMGDNQQNLEEPMSLKEWLITLLIMAIPCVGLVMVFVWAFGKSEKKSKSNYFKAILIMTVAGTAVAFLISAMLAAAAAAVLM